MRPRASFPVGRAEVPTGFQIDRSRATVEVASLRAVKLYELEAGSLSQKSALGGVRRPDSPWTIQYRLEDFKIRSEVFGCAILWEEIDSQETDSRFGVSHHAIEFIIERSIDSDTPGADIVARSRTG